MPPSDPPSPEAPTLTQGEGVEKLDKPFSYAHQAKMRASALHAELKELVRVTPEDDERLEVRQDLFSRARTLLDDIGSEILHIQGAPSVSADLGQRVEGAGPDPG